MENNIDIFIGTHKTFIPPISNKAYKIIVGNHDIENNSNLELIKCGDKNDALDDEFYSEIYMLIKLVNMDYLFKDYVGFCHYRKYFSFMDDIPDMDEMFTKYDVILPKYRIFEGSIKGQYAYYHNIEDLYIVGGIIADLYPQYTYAWNKVINNNILFPYNMFIMKREDFLEYISFVSNILSRYLKIVGFDIEKRIENNKEQYLKDIPNKPQNGEVWYQKRIGGYLAERLTNVFVTYKFKKALLCGVNITEKKY